MLIAGGAVQTSEGGTGLDIVELFNLRSLTSCVINVKLDEERAWNTGNGNIICGGFGRNGNGLSTCFDVVTRKTITLNTARAGHISWSTDAGIYLIGGGLSRTELVTGDSTQAGFELNLATTK